MLFIHLTQQLLYIYYIWLAVGENVLFPCALQASTHLMVSIFTFVQQFIPCYRNLIFCNFKACNFLHIIDFCQEVLEMKSDTAYCVQASINPLCFFVSIQLMCYVHNDEHRVCHRNVHKVCANNWAFKQPDELEKKSFLYLIRYDYFVTIVFWTYQAG